MSKKEVKDSIVNQLEKLTNLSKKEIHDGKFVLITNQLLALEEYVIYSLIKSLVIKYRKTGILKSYKISELQKWFKWKKTQLNYYLKQAVKHNVLLYNKRKYSLNLDNVLVKRVWSYYFNLTKFDSISSIEMIEITSILKKKMLFEEHIHSLNKYKENDNQFQNNDDFTDFVDEIRMIMFDGCDPKDDLVDLCWRKLSALV